jgi:hypothetical protein
MSINRWFDLSELDAKLDRRVGVNGSAYLDLTFKSEAAFERHLTADRASVVARSGWVKADEVPAIRHYGEFRDISEIGSAIETIFDPQEVERFIVGREDLRQGEILEGVDRPVYVAKEHIDQSMQHLPDMIRVRALELIEKARERQQNVKGASLGATGGKLYELAQKVSQHLDQNMATSFMRVAAVRHDPETLDQIKQYLADDSDQSRNSLEDILACVDMQEASLREARKNAIAMGYSPDEIENTAIAEYIQVLPDARDIVLDLDAPQAKAAPLSSGFMRDVHGFRFEVSADTTTLAAREYQARLSAAMDFMADTFGMDPADLFPANTRIRVVQGMANDRQRGVQISIKRTGKDAMGEDFVDQANAIVFSQATLGTALHEMVHGLSRRLGDDPVKYDEIIHGSGLMDAMNNAVAEGKMRGIRSLHDNDYVDYLVEPEEVFARMVENALRTRCLEMHGNLDPLGGHAVSGHHLNYAPLDSDTMERTIMVVRNFGEARGVMKETVIPPPVESVSAQPGAASRAKIGGR